MNRRRFLAVLGLCAAAPAAVARLVKTPEPETATEACILGRTPPSVNPEVERWWRNDMRPGTSTLSFHEFRRAMDDCLKGEKWVSRGF